MNGRRRELRIDPPADRGADEGAYVFAQWSRTISGVVSGTERLLGTVYFTPPYGETLLEVTVSGKGRGGFLYSLVGLGTDGQWETIGPERWLNTLDRLEDMYPDRLYPIYTGGILSVNSCRETAIAVRLKQGGFSGEFMLRGLTLMLRTQETQPRRIHTASLVI